MSENYSFMTTGTLNEKDEEYENDIIMQAISIYMIFAQDALKIAGTYTLHTGRKLVTEEDTIKALKIRAVNNQEFWKRNGIKEDILNMYEELKNEQMDEEEDEDENEMEIDEDEENKIPSCTCYMCEKFRNIETSWENWKPSIEEDKRLKNVIDKQCI